jgi:hypothetical protein
MTGSARIIDTALMTFKPYRPHRMDGILKIIWLKSNAEILSPSM